MTLFKFNQIVLKFFIICKYLYQSSYLQLLMLDWVVWDCKKGFTSVAWLLINIARVGVKVRVGLEKLFYKSTVVVITLFYCTMSEHSFKTVSDFSLEWVPFMCFDSTNQFDKNFEHLFYIQVFVVIFCRANKWVYMQQNCT